MQRAESSVFPGDCPNVDTRGKRKGVCCMGPSIGTTTTYRRALSLRIPANTRKSRLCAGQHQSAGGEERTGATYLAGIAGILGSLARIGSLYSTRPLPGLSHLT